MNIPETLPQSCYERAMEIQAKRTIDERLKAINERLAEIKWQEQCDKSATLSIDEYRSLLNERGCH